VGCLGYPHPVWHSNSQNTLPCRYFSLTLAQGRDSLNMPLLRFNPPSRFVPENPVLRLSAQDNSHGICSPTTHTGKESPRPHRRTGLAIRNDPRATSTSADRSHSVSYGAAHRLSQPLSDLLLSLPSCHFRTGGVHGVRPPGIYSFHEVSEDSSPPDYPLVVAPAGCATPRS
jgi:hypothetical protein